MTDLYHRKTRESIHLLIDLEQLWRENIPIKSEITKEERRKAINLLSRINENIKELSNKIEENES